MVGTREMRGNGDAVAYLSKVGDGNVAGEIGVEKTKR